MRPLRDRLAECMRWSRVGDACGPYGEQTETTRDDWRESADRLLAAAQKRGIEIRDARQA